MRRALIVLLASGSVAFASAGAAAPPAQANLLGTACGLAGWVSGLVGKACKVATGPVGKVVDKVLGGGSSSAGSHVATAAELIGIGAAAALAARTAIKIVAKAIGESTSPQLTSTWFSSTYWRVTAIAALLALPFLFAAAVQALMRSDLTLLVRAAFAYLPLAVLATAIAAPLTMLLLAASDEMSAFVSSAASGGHHFIKDTILFTGAVAVAKASPFLLILLGMLASAFAVAVWLELAVREAAVYVIVLMLPLMFSAMVWPARRVWAIRAVEILVALILSKFVIVAVLSLGSGALGHIGVVSAIAGIALLMLAAFSPWMLLRLLPMAELAGAAAGSLGDSLRSHGSTGVRAATGADPVSHVRQAIGDATGAATAWMRNQASDAGDLHTSRTGSYGGSGGTFGGATGGAGAGGGGPAPGAVASGTSAGNGSAEATANGASGPAPVPVGGANGASGSDGGTDGSGATSERLPGLSRTFQAPDGAHRPTMLGPDEYPSPPPALPADPADEPGPREDHDPRPEDQPELEDH
jgi:hypothetical protein